MQLCFSVSLDTDSQDQDMNFTNFLCKVPQLGPTYGGQSRTSLVAFDESSASPPDNDESPDSPPKNDESLVSPTCHSTGVKRSTRGVNFSHDEDKLLVTAWLNCSVDVVQRTDEKHSQLWEKIYDYFQQNKETTTERTVKSLIHRWSFIQKATNKFSAKLAEIEGLNQNGMDKVEKARIMYQSVEKSHFQFEHCWHLLKDQPKWITRNDPKPRKRMFLSPNPVSIRCSVPIDDSIFDLETENVIEREVIELDRPMSGECEKEKQKSQGTQTEKFIQHKMMKCTLLEESDGQEREFYCFKAEKMEHDKEREEKKWLLEDEWLRLEAEKLRIEAEKVQSKIRQEDERLRLKSEKIELAKKESDHRIMKMDVSVMPEMRRLYFEELQKEIMIRRSHT